MSDRYFVAHPIEGDSVTLAGAEAHHLAVVLRRRPGDVVRLFDGSGGEFEARLVTVRRDEVRLDVLAHQSIDRELPGQLVLAAALPKGDRQRWLVEKAVELGVHQLVPLRTERSVSHPRAAGIERLRRAVVEASKQCGRNVLMQLGPPTEWTAFLARATSKGLSWLADPSAPPIDRISAVRSPLSCPPTQITVAIGPEGGFTDEERFAALQAGWTSYGLGPRVLRVETAALAFCALAADLLSRGEPSLRRE
jgi:16S rRNA (uracil1498-N3)-methyltransferase